MKLVNWKLDHLDAAIDRGFLRHFDAFDADFFCIHETGVDEDALSLDLPGYEQFWQWASDTAPGAAVFTKHAPIFSEITDSAILLEYQEFFLICGDACTLTEPGKPVIRFDRDGIRIPMELEAQVYRRGNHADMGEPFPVSMDMDLVCNGSILSPSSLGSARLILQETAEETAAEEEKPKKKQKKRSVALVAVLAALLLILLIPMLGGIDKTLHVPEDLIPIEVTVLKTKLYPYNHMFSSIQAPKETDNTILLNGEKIRTDAYPVADLQQSNFWIQVALTQDALSIAEEGWILTNLGDIFSSTIDAPIEFLNFVPYYSDADREKIAGWFIFGQILKSDGFYIEITHENSDYSHHEYVNFAPFFEVTTPDQAFTAQYFLSRPETDTDDPRTPTLESYTESICITLDDIYFTYRNYTDLNPQDANYWIFVKADPLLMEQTKKQLVFTVSRLENSGGQSYFKYTRPSVVQIFSDAELTQNVGWLVFDDNPLVNDLVFSLRWYQLGEAVTEEMVYRFPTYVNELQAMTMTTEQLVRAIIKNPDLCEQLLMGPIHVVKDEVVIHELLSRVNAVTELMNWNISTLGEYESLAPYALLTLPELRQQMTTQQEVDFILGNHPSAPEPFAYSYSAEGVFTTEGILDELHHDQALWYYLRSGSAGTVQQKVYLVLREHNPLLVQLEQREDAADVMYAHLEADNCEGCPISTLLNLWSYIETLPDPAKGADVQ